MLLRMLKAYAIVVSEFRKFISPVFTFTAVLLLHILVSTGMALDHLFFPSIRRKKIVHPIVIVGNPRSGTTFLQRFLVQHGFGVGMRIWKMIYPSLTLQTLIKPFIPLLERFSPARFHAHAAHETNLTAIETDDPSFLFRYFDGLFLYGFFLAWANEDHKGMFDPEIRDTSERDFNWLEKIWIRNLVGEKQERVVAKLFSLGVKLPRFLKRFPDAKLLYLIRDPLQTVPSALSLVTGVLDGRFGFWSLPDERRKHYIERLYAAFLELSLRFYHDYISGKLSNERVKIVVYDRMMHDFDKLMAEIIDFVDVTPSEDQLKAIQNTANVQRAYKSKHNYHLEKFGLDEARIKRDYAPIYNTFLTKMEHGLNG